MSTTPYVIEQTSRRERGYDIFSRLLPDGIIFSGEEVGDVSVSLTIVRMLFLEAQDPEKNIQLYINNPDGSVSAGFVIYGTMQYIKCDVPTIYVGLAASFGAFLSAGGAKGKRIALPNAEIMIHQLVIHGNEIRGQVTNIKITSDHTRKSKKRLNMILTENTGKSIDEAVIATERDNYMTMEEVMNFGLIDRITDRR